MVRTPGSAEAASKSSNMTRDLLEANGITDQTSPLKPLDRRSGITAHYCETTPRSSVRAVPVGWPDLAELGQSCRCWPKRPMSSHFGPKLAGSGRPMCENHTQIPRGICVDQFWSAFPRAGAAGRHFRQARVLRRVLRRTRIPLEKGVHYAARSTFQGDYPSAAQIWSIIIIITTPH